MTTTPDLPQTRRAALLDMADQLDGQRQYGISSTLNSSWLREVAVVLRSRAQDYPETEERAGELLAVERAPYDPVQVRGTALMAAGLRLNGDSRGLTLADLENVGPHMVAVARALEAYVLGEVTE